MQRTRTLLLLLVAVIFILTGCSTPAPLSETIIFSPHRVKSDTTGSYRGSFALIPAYNFDKNSVLRYGKQKYAPALGKSHGMNLEYYNYQKFGLGISDMFTHSDNWAVDWSIGYAILGFDFTTRIKGPYYLTAQTAVLGGDQLILQRPIFKMGSGGITLGPYYRFDSYYIGSGGYAINLERFLINSVGLRSFFQFQSRYIPFYGYIESGYSPELKRVLFYVDFTTPILKFR